MRPFRPGPSAELRAREREHNTRRRVHLLAGIEREAEALGLAPTSRQELAGATTVLAANGKPIATVRVRRRNGTWYEALDEVVVAELPDGEGEWYPGVLGLRRAG
jgi:hypothetical protein